MAEPVVVEARSTRWSDDRVETLLGNWLRAGVFFAAFIASVGGVVYFAKYGGRPAMYHLFVGEPMQLRSLREIVDGAFHLRSRWIIQLGILLLIATPIMRVAMSLVAFALQRDRLYVGITLIVLSLLMVGLFVGVG